MSKTLHLIYEDFSENKYSEGDVYSLTPQASFALDQKGIRYQILEDTYSEEELRKDQDAYLAEQVAWIGELDEFLQSQIPLLKEMGVQPFRSYFSRFKFLTDTLVIRSQILDRFFSKHPYEKVYWYSEEPNQTNLSIYEVKKRVEALYLGILESLAQKHGFELVVQTKTYSEKKRMARRPNRSSLKEMLSQTPVKALAQFLKLKKFSQWSPRHRHAFNMRILFLDQGNFAIDDIMRELLKEGAQVYTQNSQGIFKVNSFQEVQVFSFLECEPSASSTQDLSDRFREVAAALEGDQSLAAWPNAKAGCPIWNLLIPSFRDFLIQECPQWLFKVHGLAEFYKGEEIDYVVTRGIGHEAGIALNSAKIAGALRVCFQHNCSALDLKDWNIDNLDLFDAFFATDTESEAYHRKALEAPYLGECQIFQSSHTLKHLRAQRMSLQRRDPGRKKVLFIPKKFSGNLVRFNTTIYSLPWYFEFLKELVTFFAEQKEFVFIYKHFPYNQEWAERSILPFIRNQKFSNVVIEDKPMTHYASKVDKVLMDYPATALYEAALLDLPVLSLCWHVFEKRASAFEMFGPAIQTFETSEEAKEKIKTFLNAPAKDYRPIIPYSEDQGTKILMGMHQVKRG